MRVFMCSALIVSSICAETISLKEGWNLVGIPTNSLSVEQISANSSVEKVFSYKSNEWLKSGNLNSGDAIWISAKEPTTIDYNDSKSDERRDVIKLQEGWNLVANPINSSVTPKLFGENSDIWQYEDSNWSGSDYENKIVAINGGEGFWIKSDSEREIVLSDEEAKLNNFNNHEEMVNYIDNLVKFNKSFKSYITPYPYPLLAADGAVATQETAGNVKNDSVTDATNTNTQEVDVDEADIIKHNNNKIFYLSNYETNAIYQTTFTDLLDGKAPNSIKTDKRASNLYIHDDKLVAIYPNSNNFWIMWEDKSSNIWRDESKIEIYDINSLSKIYDMSFDGNIVDTRVVDGKLFIVNRFMPYYEVTYNKKYVECQEPTDGVALKMMIWNPCQKDDVGYFEYDYENPVYKDSYLIPQIDVNGTKKELISPQTLYAPAKFDQSPFITSLISFDLNSFSNSSVSVVGDTSTIYSSTEALYLVSENYPIYYGFNDYKVRSLIYKFDIKNLSYIDNIFIDGTILNQFSLSEYNSTLRVATTSWTFNGESQTDNAVYAIKENSGNLEIASFVNGLGGVGESIRGVRFLGDKGFVVTFRQKDPLYTVDLSNPDAIKVVGELNITGYSAYFHPVSNEQIMSVGRDAKDDGTLMGVQLELFDISNLANPKLIDKKVTIGDNYYNSEAEYNHKAFTYRESDKLFALPISYYSYTQNSSTNYNELQLYKIVNDKITKINSFTPSGVGYGDSRSVIFKYSDKDYVLYLLGDKLNVFNIF